MTKATQIAVVSVFDSRTQLDYSEKTSKSTKFFRRELLISLK
jgi:hypothetical protein